jgi:hypothetical protein
MVKRFVEVDVLVLVMLAVGNLHRGEVLQPRCFSSFSFWYDESF